MRPTRTTVIGFWIATALFSLQIGFTAYAQLRLPQVADAFTHLGFPAYFRVELSWAKLVGVVLLLAPVPPRLKEWAYAGFAIDLASALIAHLAVGGGVGLGGSHRGALGTLVLLLAQPAGHARERPGPRGDNTSSFPRSGTGDLSGLRGEGGFEGEFGKGSQGALDYWFE